MQSVPLAAVLEIALGHGTKLRPVFTGPVRLRRLLLSEAGAPEMVLEAAAHSPPGTPHDEVALTVQYGATLRAFEVEQTASTFKGRATLAGITAAIPGVLMALRGVGDDFGGNVCITTARHFFSRDGWTTQVEFFANR